jgi:hypothetical protein
MKSFLLAICAVLALILGYCWWRTGDVVLSKSFDGFNIRVRKAPDVSGNILASPPGVAANAFTIEIGGYHPQSTYRLNPSSESLSPVKIVQIGQSDERTFQVAFSNGEKINVRIANGRQSLVEWFRASP